MAYEYQYIPHEPTQAEIDAELFERLSFVQLVYYASITTDEGRVTHHGLPTLHDAFVAGEALQDAAYSVGAKIGAHGQPVYPAITVGTETAYGSPLT